MRQIFELDFTVSQIDGSVSRDESNMFGSSSIRKVRDNFRECSKAFLTSVERLDRRRILNIDFFDLPWFQTSPFFTIYSFSSFFVTFFHVLLLHFFRGLPTSFPVVCKLWYFSNYHAFFLLVFFLDIFIFLSIKKNLSRNFSGIFISVVLWNLLLLI